MPLIDDQEDRCVFVAHGEAEAQQVCAFLRTRGMRPRIRGEALRKVHGLALGDLSAVQILVPAFEEDEARALLASVEAGEFQLSEDVESEHD
jgi:hypothetical protein